MKVLVVIESLGFGGAERLLVTLLPAMKQSGVECDVAVLHGPYSLTPELKTLGIKVFHLDIKHRWLIPDSLLRLHKVIKPGRYDAIWGHLYFGNLYAMLAGLLMGIDSRVMTLHSSGYQDSPPKRLWDHIRLNIEKFLGNKLASKIVAVSNATANDYAVSLGWRSITVVHNAIPVNHLPLPIGVEERIRIRVEYGIGEDEFLLVTAARYVRDKGHSVMLVALAKFRDVHGWCPRWIAASHGPLKCELEQMSESLSLSGYVSLLDALPQAELFRLIQAADVFVLPSLSEPFGIAAGEALALGTPCILSEVGGLCELAGVGDTSVAKMIVPNDPVVLCDAIWEIFSDAAGREERVSEGKKRMNEKFATSVVVQQWCSVFNEINRSVRVE